FGSEAENNREFEKHWPGGLRIQSRRGYGDWAECLIFARKHVPLYERGIIVSAGPNPRVDSQVIEQERRRLSRRLDEVARLCEANLPPSTFYGELLKRLLESLAAPAGVIWARTPQGNLQQQFQINAKEVGLERSEEARQSH